MTTIARIEKRFGIQAPVDHIWAVIEQLDGWDRWNPIETGIRGTIAFGGKVTLTETLPGTAPRPVEAHVSDWQPNSQLVWTEKRGLWFQSMRYFEIEELEPGSSIVANGFIFTGLRGEMYFDKHKKVLGGAVETVAEAWRAAIPV
ncbi:MAG: SRPBCC domain-containing protein [Alphaproteobacteria bacterium]|nr:MAG: SRPBCC domain-containing protein [Alphaproteobacteria bacterium]